MAPGIIRRRRRRGRNTDTLLRLSWERFHACEHCNKSFVSDFADDVIGRIRLTTLERRRLVRVLRCPNCESNLELLDEVVGYDRRQMAEIRRHETWARRFAGDFATFERFLESYPSLGAFHRMGAALSSGIKRLAPTALPAGTWYRARRWREARS